MPLSDASFLARGLASTRAPWGAPAVGTGGATLGAVRGGGGAGLVTGGGGVGLDGGGGGRAAWGG